MKKFTTLFLAVVLMATIAATCFADPHTHVYHFATAYTEYLSDGHHQVAGCHNCTFSHTHSYSRTRGVTIATCTCGAEIIYRTAINNGPEHCPYSH